MQRQQRIYNVIESPSMRREWIEILDMVSTYFRMRTSPSMRREWIEIIGALCKLSNYMSPSMRREWIEIPESPDIAHPVIVSLHAEGVD